MVEICGRSWVRRLKAPSSGKFLRTFRIADLFCGCGGLSLGIAEAMRVSKIRMEISLAVDINADAIAVYRRNFRTDDSVARQANLQTMLPGNLCDPFKSEELKLRDQVGTLDCVVAGPPCQGHSDLNNSTRRQDPRNQLYLKVIRFVDLMRPKVVIVENVPAVVHDQQDVVGTATRHLKSIGYSVATEVLNTSKLGLAQIRKRHILVGVYGTRPVRLDRCDGTNTTTVSGIRDFISDIVDEPQHREGNFYTASKMTLANRKRVEFLFQNNAYDLPDSERPECHKYGHSYNSMYGRMRWNGPAQTITSGFGCMGQGRFVHPQRPRTLTPHEAARIQGFPDFFDFSSVEKRTSLHEMIGNAVPPKLAAAVMSHLLSSKLL